MASEVEKERARKRRQNKIAKDLRTSKYRQRVKPSKKEYKRKKIKPEEVEDWYDE